MPQESGQIAPHLELSQHPIRKRKTYDEYPGEAALEAVGRRRWNKRVRKIIGILETVVTYDTLYIGGGNAELIELPLPANAKFVFNTAGITGGVRLWDSRMDHAIALVALRQRSADFRLDPLHALLGRACAQVPAAVRKVAWSERVTKEIEASCAVARRHPSLPPALAAIA